MMMIITKKDIDKMSIELRNELMRIMFYDDQNEDILRQHQEIDFEEYENMFSQTPDVDLPSNEKTDDSKSKKVVDINDEEAQALLANLSDKSINTLKYFTSGDAVMLNELIGNNKTYSSFIELKRSFVGPVNRRLRTVIKDRSAVLFKKIDEDEFSVKEGTAVALKKVFKKMEGKIT